MHKTQHELLARLWAAPPPGGQQAWLFNSHASGTADKYNDVDVIAGMETVAEFATMRKAGNPFTCRGPQTGIGIA